MSQSKKKWGKRCRNHCCYHKRNDTTSSMSQPAYRKARIHRASRFQMCSFLVRKSFLKGKSKQNPSLWHSWKLPSSLLPSQPPFSSAFLLLSSCTSPPPAASASLLPVGASFPAPSSSAPLVFLLEFAKDVESVCINCLHRHDGNKKATHRVKSQTYLLL